MAISRGIYLFPKAKVYVQQQELDRVLHDAATGTVEVFCVPCDVENWEKTRGQMGAGSSDVREIQLCPGVSILNFGPAIPMVCWACMWNLRMKISAGFRRGLQPGVLRAAGKTFGAVYDKEGYFSAIEYIREYAQRRQAEVLFGHDMEQFKGLKKVTGASMNNGGVHSETGCILTVK